MIYGKNQFLVQVNVQIFLILDESINTINEKGNYFISKFKNSKVPSISLLKRKDLNQNNYPGPGNY
jgi:hypothetical protein